MWDTFLNSGWSIFVALLFASLSFGLLHYGALAKSRTASNKTNRAVQASVDSTIKVLKSQIETVIGEVQTSSKSNISKLNKNTEAIIKDLKEESTKATSEINKETKKLIDKIQDKTNEIQKQTNKLAINSEYDVVFVKVEYKLDQMDPARNESEVFKHFVNNYNYELLIDETKYNIVNPEFEMVDNYSLIMYGNSNLYHNNSFNTWDHGKGYYSLVVTYRFSILGSFNIDLENFAKDGKFTLLLLDKTPNTEIIKQTNFNKLSDLATKIKPAKGFIKFKNDKNWRNFESTHSSFLLGATGYYYGRSLGFKISEK